MTDRISSAMIPLSAIANLSQAQQQLIEAARESSAQTKADDLKGYGQQAQTLVSTQRVVARTQSYIDTGNELKTRMSLQDVALGHAADQISSLKDALTQNLSLDDGDGVRSELEETFSVLKDAMNTNVGGSYLFGGVLNDRPPITAADTNALANNPITASIQQGATPQVAQIEDGRTIQTGLVASNVVTSSLTAVQNLVQTDNGTDGPFGGPLTDNQKTAIQNAIAQLNDAYNDMLSSQAENGQLSKDVDTSQTRQQSQLDALNGAVGDITNVDLAQVAVQLNQAQYAYQASAQVFASIKGLSLINYLNTSSTV